MSVFAHFLSYWLDATVAQSIFFAVNPGEIVSVDVNSEADGLRLDRFLADYFGRESSRSQVQRWIKEGAVQDAATGASAQASRPVHAGERYQIVVPEAAPLELRAEEVSFQVVFEDDVLAVIHKPPGLAVHPGPGDRKTTLIHGLLYKWKEMGGVGMPERPGIVHRLDSDTEGLMVVAKTSQAHRVLSQQFQERTVTKEYAAWLLGSPPETEGRIELSIARHPRERLKMRVDGTGRLAVTEYKAEKFIMSRRGRKFSFVSVKILTGRTHQIRVHFAHLGCPIVGDRHYSRSANEFAKFGLLLFARRLAFQHPVTAETMSFSLELPRRFTEFERLCIHH
ncbi:MAG: RluA family pseudouridine synthase [Spirochaetia bacterium]|nr:RluA family pseudouridine synthase [Spirochaetia bacterium]